MSNAIIVETYKTVILDALRIMNINLPNDIAQRIEHESDGKRLKQLWLELIELINMEEKTDEVLKLISKHL
jgi:uncharacterized protein (UPF0212 family)